MNRINKLIVAAVLAASSATIFAQGYNGPSTTAAAASTYTGPSAVPNMTAKQLLANGANKQYVTLTGKLVRHTGGKHYILADASGEIQVEISQKHFPLNQTIDANTTVELTGKFDKERFGTSEVEVEQVKVVSK